MQRFSERSASLDSAVFGAALSSCASLHSPPLSSCSRDQSPQWSRSRDRACSSQNSRDQSPQTQREFRTYSSPEGQRDRVCSSPSKVSFGGGGGGGGGWGGAAGEGAENAASLEGEGSFCLGRLQALPAQAREGLETAQAERSLSVSPCPSNCSSPAKRAASFRARKLSKDLSDLTEHQLSLEGVIHGDGGDGVDWLDGGGSQGDEADEGDEGAEPTLARFSRLSSGALFGHAAEATEAGARLTLALTLIITQP